MISLAWRNIRSARATSALTLLGIAVAVASLWAMELGTDAAMASVQKAYSEASARSSLTVLPPGGALAPLPADVLATLATTPGIAEVWPQVRPSSLRVVDRKSWGGPLLTEGTDMLVVLGVEPMPQDSRWRLVEGGWREDGVLISAGWAKARDVKVGDSLQLVAGESNVTWKISGLIGRAGLGGHGGGSVAIAPLAKVRRAFSMRPSTVHEAALVLEKNVDVDAMAKQLRESFGGRAAVLRPHERGRDIEQRLVNMNAGTDLIRTVVLFASALLVFSVFSSTAARRRRSVGLLRCIGGTKHQARSLFLLEVTMLAIPGTLLGLLLALPLAHGVAGVFGQVAGVEVSTLHPQWSGAWRAALLGLVVPWGSALWPAIKAAREPPIKALRQGEESLAQHTLHRTGGWIPGMSLTLLATLGIAISETRELTYGCVLLVLAGLTLALPSLMPFVARRLRARALERGSGVLALGTAALAWQPRRSGLAAGAVMVCVAMVGGVSGISGGLKSEMAAWTDRALGWDVFVSSPSGLSHSAIETIRNTPRVRRAAAITLRPGLMRHGDHQIHGGVVGIDPERYAIEKILTFAPETKAAPEALVRGLHDLNLALVTTVMAQQFGLAVGTSFEVATPKGTKTLKVSGIVVDYTENGFAIFVDQRFLAAYYHAQKADLLAVRVEEGGLDQVVAALGSSDVWTVERSSSLRKRVMKRVDGAMSALDLLLWLTGFIGWLAVAAAFGQNAAERRAELGVLRGLGATTSEVKKMVLIEGLTTALVGLLPGLLLGVGFAWVFSEATHTLGIPIPFIPPWSALVVAAFTSLLAATLASVGPALRAAGSPPGRAAAEAR